VSHDYVTTITGLASDSATSWGGTWRLLHELVSCTEGGWQKSWTPAARRWAAWANQNDSMLAFAPQVSTFSSGRTRGVPPFCTSHFCPNKSGRQCHGHAPEITPRFVMFTSLGYWTRLTFGVFTHQLVFAHHVVFAHFFVSTYHLVSTHHLVFTYRSNKWVPGALLSQFIVFSSLKILLIPILE
jgi:hypothetical protein